MKYIAFVLVFVCAVVASPFVLLATANDEQTYTFESQRRVGQVDHVNIVLEVGGDILTKSGTDEKPQRQELGLTYRRDYDEKTLALPTVADKALRGIRFYHSASATGRKGTAVLKPKLGEESRLVAVEIVGGKETPFSPKGPLGMDELELVSAVGDSLPLDQLLPGKPVKVGDSWQPADDTLALLLALDEMSSNSVQMALNEVTPEFARFELTGSVEGKLFGADNRISLKGKCRFDRHTGRIDWFAMRLKQSRDIGMVEAGIDATVLVQIKIGGLEASEKLSDAALADLPLKPTPELTSIRYLLSGGGCQLTHDRSWFLIDASRDHDEFHRLDRGQDIGLCKISRQPQGDVSKLPSLEQFRDIVQKLLGDRVSEFVEMAQAETPAHLRVLRLKAKGTDDGVSVRWVYYLVSDPEGRQATFSFRVEEKCLEQFGRADEPLVHSLRFVEKK